MPELLEQLIDVRTRLLEAAVAVAPKERDQPFVGHWNLKQLLAHLVGWDYTNIEAVKELQAGRLPGFYASHDPDWAGYKLAACGAVYE